MTGKYELEMNLPETEFYNAYHEWTAKIPGAKNLLVPQVQIGKYRVDFLYKDKYVIEVDRQAFHEGEQRQKDYERERWLMRQGYKVVRFTASEVIRQGRHCITELMEIVYSKANMFDDEKQGGNAMQ
jgi:very-short-patch-repair endonuclease